MKTLVAAFLLVFAFVAVAGAVDLSPKGDASFTKVADDKPINKKCPVSGKDVDPKQTSTYKDQVIGFCCGDCKGKFDKEPEKYIGKVKEFKKK